jgi:hypothetical protein
MDPRIKVIWTDELRSGKYKQGIGFLEKDDKYCCLGILCELYIKEIGAEDCPTVSYCINDQNEEYPNQAILDWAGLGHYEAMQLGQMNDDGKDFIYIADHIDVVY